MTVPKRAGSERDLAMYHRLNLILAQVDDALALLLPRCTRCLHPLRAPKSIRLGMGPVCRSTVPAKEAQQ